MKLDKGNGILLIGTNDYYTAVKNLFSDESKFKEIHGNPTPARLSSILRYLKKLNNRNELNDKVFKKIRPQNAKLVRAHGLPKVHKTFNSIPPFRPITDTTGTAHYSVGKYLSELLNPLTQNMHTVKDSFDAANKINQILPDVHNSDEYVFVSLDLVSLFTNAPLKKTVDIILKRIYTGKEITTTLTKRSLKKLILDTCQKTAFSFNGKMYEQTDGVSMRGSLGPVLANIIMTECEKVILNQLIENNIVKFYIRYVDDTLLVLRKKDIDIVLTKLNSFNKNLKFTVDTFENCVPHFLDIEICSNGLGIYHINTQTGRYTNIESFTLWKWKTS